MLAPVLLICFDRPAQAAKTIQALQNTPCELYLFRDGGGEDKDREAFAELFKETERTREAKTRSRLEEKNHGHRDGPKEALRWFFSQVSAGIILEEDILPAAEMVETYSKALKFFEKDTTIFALGSAPNKNVVAPGPLPWTRSPLFLVWGWASWADRIHPCQIPNSLWEKFENQMLKPFASLTAKLYLDREFKNLAKNPQYCWSYYLQFHALTSGKDILIPETKLTQNQGINGKARRTKSNPDQAPTPEECNAVNKKDPGANPNEREWQRKIEKAKFISLFHELRNRLQIRKKVLFLFRIENGRKKA